MKKAFSVCGVVLAMMLMAGCSGSDEETIQEKAEEVGRQAAEQIKAPIEQAELAKQLQDAHNKQIEEAAKKQ